MTRTVRKFSSPYSIQMPGVVSLAMLWPKPANAAKNKMTHVLWSMWKLGLDGPFVLVAHGPADFPIYTCQQV